MASKNKFEGHPQKIKNEDDLNKNKNEDDLKNKEWRRPKQNRKS